jgi:hypothetical protein
MTECGVAGGKIIDRDGRRTWRKTRRTASLSTTNPTRLHLGQNLGSRFGTPTTNRMSYETRNDPSHKKLVGGMKHRVDYC